MQLDFFGLVTEKFENKTLINTLKRKGTIILAKYDNKIKRI